MNEYLYQLATYVESISDDFGSTFSVVDKNTLSNFMGRKDDFEKLIRIILNYIPSAVIGFKKTNIFCSSL